MSQGHATISEFEKEIELLQTQKIDVEKHVQSQKREMREKMSEITKQLLESYDIADVRSRLSVEDLEHLNEDGELWFAYEGLKKATRTKGPMHEIRARVGFPSPGYWHWLPSGTQDPGFPRSPGFV
ncbi:Myosin-Vc [Myotis brandtii]|uniref:Myosin-Vc n=1 Tax=Myotis brandtii TaxID=109478 RepID=S7QH20_MYOBR|nr:Myosin-Vc [Myotis brandtii]